MIQIGPVLLSFLSVVIKVNLCSRDTENLEQLSERLINLHYKPTLRSDTKERAINQLIDRGIEIIGYCMDRQVGLYVWCKSPKGHENFRIFCESKSIADVMKNASSASEPIGSRTIDVDVHKLMKTIGKFVYSVYIDTRVQTSDSYFLMIPPLSFYFLIPPF